MATCVDGVLNTAQGIICYHQVFYLRKGSLLADRLLRFTASIPYNETDIQHVVKNICEPMGYWAASSTEYGCACSLLECPGNNQCCIA